MIIDTHHHFYAPAYQKAWLDWEDARELPHYPSQVSWSPEKSVEEMDKNKVSLAVLSLASTPGVWFDLDRQAVIDMARLCNEYGAGLVRDHPGIGPDNGSSRCGLRASAQPLAPIPPFCAGCRAVRLHMRTVEAELVRNIARSCNLLEQTLPKPTLRPSVVTIVDRGRRAVFRRTSRQRHPVLRTCKMPLMTRRSSTRGLPGLPRGRCGSIAAHASSDSQNRRVITTSRLDEPNQKVNAPKQKRVYEFPT